MRKFVAVLATLIVGASVLAGGATADGTSTPLFEDRGFGCGVIDRGGGAVFTTESYIVWRQNGDVYLRCEADGTAGATIETTKGFLCGLGQFGLTTRSVNVVRRAGRIQLECWGHVNPGDTVIESTGGYGAS